MKENGIAHRFIQQINNQNMKKILQRGAKL
jgi:hypothetical protein